MKRTLFYVFLLGLLAACADRDWESKENSGLEFGETKLVIRTTLKLFGDQPASGITSRAAAEYTDAPGTSDDETDYQELVNKYSLTNDYENYVGNLRVFLLKGDNIYYTKSFISGTPLLTEGMEEGYLAQPENETMGGESTYQVEIDLSDLESGEVTDWSQKFDRVVLIANQPYDTDGKNLYFDGLKNKPETTTSFASYNVPRRMVVRTDDELEESIGRRQVGLLMVGYADARFTTIAELKEFNSNALINLWRTTNKTVVDVIRDKSQSTTQYQVVYGGTLINLPRVMPLVAPMYFTSAGTTSKYSTGDYPYLPLWQGYNGGQNLKHQNLKQYIDDNTNLYPELVKADTIKRPEIYWKEGKAYFRLGKGYDPNYDEFDASTDRNDKIRYVFYLPPFYYANADQQKTEPSLGDLPKLNIYSAYPTEGVSVPYDEKKELADQNLQVKAYTLFLYGNGDPAKDTMSEENKYYLSNRLNYYRVIFKGDKPRVVQIQFDPQFNEVFEREVSILEKQLDYVDSDQ